MKSVEERAKEYRENNPLLTTFHSEYINKLVEDAYIQGAKDQAELDNPPKNITDLWEEWRFTNDWKAARDFTSFAGFLQSKGIKYEV